MPRINLKSVNQDAVESRELRDRRRLSEKRNIRRTLHKTRLLARSVRLASATSQIAGGCQ